MKFLVAGAAAACLWTATAVHAALTAQTTTWSGVYTDAQAKRGQEAYTKACAECHGQDLGGDGFAPGLKGPDFMTNWSGLSVGDLYDRIRISMPPDNPNSLPAKDKVDIVAYVLKENGFPAGTTELATAVEALKGIKIEANKPGR